MLELNGRAQKESSKGELKRRDQKEKSKEVHKGRDKQKVFKMRDIQDRDTLKIVLSLSQNT